MRHDSCLLANAYILYSVLRMANKKVYNQHTHTHDMHLPDGLESYMRLFLFATVRACVL